MGDNFTRSFGAVVLVAIIAALMAFVALCTWVLWSAAVSVPQPYRMRWPWVIWLVLVLLPVPFFYQVICFAILLPLPLSYRRFLGAHGVTKGGQYGFGLTLLFCILQLLGLLTHVPKSTPWLHAAWPWAADVGQWAEFGASITFLVLVFSMWDLRTCARNLNKFTQSGSADTALCALTNLKPDCEGPLSASE